MKLEVNWSISARIFVDGKLSHTIKVPIVNEHHKARIWELYDDGKGSRLKGLLETEVLQKALFNSEEAVRQILEKGNL